MLFKFLNNIQAPEWFIQEYQIISKIKGTQLELIINSLVNSIQYKSPETKNELNNQLLNFNDFQINSIISCIQFILVNSAFNKVSKEALTNDLIDLGLPLENCEILSECFKQNQKQLQNILELQNFMINEIKQFKVSDHICLNTDKKFSIIELNEDQYNIDEFQKQQLLEELKKIKQQLHLNNKK